ncbi:hypothetical protein Q0Z83_073950 [Actinoplanes sichuanensis]|uniref:Uncharacterized protein n=1 Tax=Actinoplanes sichuanensis TaxID=512349 RepID=A0ABW4A8N9_9ACTN|nr:hypothetical protein [Actinoplanes sichuanensis]BEL09204.1 hypothetical protein Q0Z83_073950 [Actinoplanes sichuanensis]
MSSKQRRPQIRRGLEGNRVVLVAPRNDLSGADLRRVMDEIAAAHWVLATIVDPADWRTAFRLILDGDADILLTTRHEHLPAIQLVRGCPLKAMPVVGESSVPTPSEQGGALPPSTPSRQPFNGGTAGSRRPNVLRRGVA